MLLSFRLPRLAALIAPGCLLAAACGSNADVQPQIPYAPVNLSISTTQQEYATLRFDNGAVSLPAKGPAGSGGVKGVIVVRQSAGIFLAFERNCPYRPLRCLRHGIARPQFAPVHA